MSSMAVKPPSPNMINSGIQSVFNRVGQLFKNTKENVKVTTSPSPPSLPTVIRPRVVPQKNRWSTCQISVSTFDSQRQLTDIICRNFSVSKALVYRLLRDGKIIVARAIPISVPAPPPGGDGGGNSGEGLMVDAEPEKVKEWCPRENIRMQAGDLLKLTEIVLPPRREELRLPTKRNTNGLTLEIIKYMQSLVIYKDDRIIIINKPSGVSVHAGAKNERHIEGYLEALKYDSEIAPLLVHRLDKGTSGALILARTRPVAAELAKLIRESSVDKRRLEKVYWALVKGGKPSSKDRMNGEIVTNIYRMREEPNERMTSFADKRAELLDEGKVAITKFRWLQVHEKEKKKRSLTKSGGEKLSLLELVPLTGRTHQLRVHCAEQLRLPIHGDYRYFPNQLPDLKLHLHCYRVTLRDWLGPNKHLTIKASIPDHFISTMNSYPLKLDKVPSFARR